MHPGPTAGTRPANTAKIAPFYRFFLFGPLRSPSPINGFLGLFPPPPPLLNWTCNFLPPLFLPSVTSLPMSPLLLLPLIFLLLLLPSPAFLDSKMLLSSTQSLPFPHIFSFHFSFSLPKCSILRSKWAPKLRSHPKCVQRAHGDPLPLCWMDPAAVVSTRSMISDF